MACESIKCDETSPNKLNSLIQPKGTKEKFTDVLPVMDVFSRFHWLSLLQRKFPHHVTEQLFEIFSEYGPPDRVQSDSGGELMKDVKKVCCSPSFLLLRSRFYSYC